MAMERFQAPALPVPPVEYDQRYHTDLIRILRLYFNQLDSLTPNQANSYRADNFYGGNFTGSNVTADSVTTDLLTAYQAYIFALTAQATTVSYLNADAIYNRRYVGSEAMIGSVYSNYFYGSGRYLSTPYNQFESRVNQTAPNIATANVLELEVTDFADNIEITGVNDTRITFLQNGIYFVTYSLQFKNTTNDAQSIDIWIRYNGNNYDNSNTRFTIPARKSTGDPSYLVAVTTIAGDAINDNDYVEIMWRVSDVGVTLEYLPAVTASPGVTPDIPATPSAIVQASFISAQFPTPKLVAPLPVFGFGQVGTVTIYTP
jgi:hypothetical protein